MKRLLWAFLVMTLALVCTPTGWGQGQITTATVQGDVLDENGGSVPGASVEAKNLDTNFTQTATTSADGHFAFLSLAPGRYTVTVSKSGFATVVQENVNLTVGQAISLPVSVKVSTVAERVVVSATPTIEVTKTESSTTLNQLTVSETPILGRKFEDLLTLTPGVSISQGPDGDEINFSGQRGVYNNISLDGGDYNNRFFGEQLGGQRAAIDITLDAVKEFQVVASGASAEFGRTAGGVVNVITKSGTNEVHGSLFEYFRTEALAAATSDGKPLKDFRRNQFGGSVGGPIVKNKMFFFGAAEGIRETLTRPNLSVPIGTACSNPNVAFDGTTATDLLISGSGDCQRLALIKFFNSKFSQDEGRPIVRPVRNASAFGKYDWNVTQAHALAASYSFDYSKNTNQTFDVPTFGNSANGTEGPSKIQVVNANLNSTLSGTKLNEAHFTYARESRPRAAAPGTVPDTGIGFGPSFRFGMPFFLEPTVNELLYHTEVRDNFSIVSGKHTIKFGGEWLHTRNTQIFRGFFTGRYIFSDVPGFLHYATPGGAGFGPTAAECPGNVFVDRTQTCPGGGAPAGILLLYLQHAATSGPTTDATGASSIKNEDYGLFIQDKWQIWPGFTFNYGLRWEAVIFPDPVTPPSKTAYGVNLSNPAFPSDGTIHNQKKEFQPRVGFAWDLFKNQKSVLRASWGIYNARQNMLAQVGAITTNGVQQQTIAAGTFFNTAGGPPPTYPNVVPTPVIPQGTFPPGAGVTVFPKDYADPRVYHTDVGFEQELYHNLAVYAEFALAKGVHMTREINPNVSPAVHLPANGDSVTYGGQPGDPPKPFGNLGDITDTVSSAKSLYRGVTFGIRKRFSQHFQMEANYTYSKDLDDDSNERDPFTFRYANLFNLAAEYSNSDRDERHKFNFFTYAELPWGFQADVRMQAHSAQPITDNFTASPTGPACSPTNSNTRFVNGIDCGRNHLRKDNAFFSFDWRLLRPFRFGDRFAIVPTVEMFNTFNNKNNINSAITNVLFNFDGFLRQGVGDPRQAQLSVRFEF